jgi:hypothetical protein
MEEEKRGPGRPKMNSASEKELDKAEKQFEMFDAEIKSMTLDRMNTAPTPEVEPQTKLASSEIAKHKDLYMKPKRAIGSREKFNEDYRKDYNFSKEYVHFIAENKEIIGESINFWIKAFPGMPAEEWDIPVNKPIWAPRYVAERIKGCKHHRLVMRDTPAGGDHQGNQYYGAMAVDTTVQRLDAYPVTERKSIFMGEKAF